MNSLRLKLRPSTLLLLVTVLLHPRLGQMLWYPYFLLRAPLLTRYLELVMDRLVLVLCVVYFLAWWNAFTHRQPQPAYQAWAEMALSVVLALLLIHK